MTAVTPATGCDPWQMALIHRLIRRGFEQARDAVGSRPDATRIAAIADYVQFHLDGLHAHHTSEDELLWPRLHERADMARDLVVRMEHQHQALHGAVDRVRKNLARWTSNQTPRTANELVDSLAVVLAGLTEHLSEEEEHVVPLIAVHITQREWEALGRASFAKFKPSQRLTALGEMLRTATPQEAARMMAELPPPPKLVWRLFGRRKYERLMAQVTG